MLLVATLAVLAVLPAVAAASNTLGTYGTLTTNQAIVSPDGHYELLMQSDGNLVIYDGSTAVWDTKTNGKATGGSRGPKPPAAVTSCPAPRPRRRQ